MQAALYIESEPINIVDGACLLQGFVSRFESGFDQQLLAAIKAVRLRAPFRNMVTPGGYTMSVAMTNCGRAGWVTDRKGYRYSEIDPTTGLPWPAMPEVFLQIAQSAALAAGYQGFVPDACLINRYEPGARMALHQDKDEHDATAPIVSVSLGLTATFMFGGLQRNDKAKRFKLEHGDVFVWGGTSRFNFHGIASLKTGMYPLLGEQRINLTFRKALADSA